MKLALTLQLQQAPALSPPSPASPHPASFLNLSQACGTGLLRLGEDWIDKVEDVIVTVILALKAPVAHHQSAS
jgi:hypothetical protein